MLAKTSQDLTSLSDLFYLFICLFLPHAVASCHLFVLDSLFAFISLKEFFGLCGKVFLTGHRHAPENVRLVAVY